MTTMKAAVCGILMLALVGTTMADKIVDFDDHGMTHDLDLSAGLNTYGGGQLQYAGINGTLAWHDLDDLTGMYYGSAWDGNSEHRHAVLWSAGGSYTFDGMTDTDVLVNVNPEAVNGEGTDTLAIYDDLFVLLENAGTVYRATAIGDNSPTNLHANLVYTKADLKQATWAEFDMAAVSLVSDGSTISLEEMDQVTGVGITVSPSGGNVFINGFEAYAVPEPASMTLLGLGGLAVLIRRRRK